MKHLIDNPRKGLRKLALPQLRSAWGKAVETLSAVACHLVAEMGHGVSVRFITRAAVCVSQLPCWVMLSAFRAVSRMATPGPSAGRK